MNAPLATRIEDYLRAHPGQAYKTKELARLLGLPKQGDAYQAFKTALRMLATRGVIARVHGQRWAAPIPLVDAGPPPTGMGVAQAASPRTTRSGRAAGTTAPAARTPRKSPRPVTPDLVEGMEVVGTLMQPGSQMVVRPAGRQPGQDILVRKADRGQAREGDRVVVVVTDPWGPGLPRGIVRTVLGREGVPSVELETIARRYGLSLDFPPDVVAEVHAIAAQIPREEVARRLDLRKLRCFTIDPADARDHDDAVSIEIDAEGHFLVGVHIADVSHYVRQGTALDREAFARGTSVYLVDGVIPMLPERLSNELCSLQEGKDRLAYSVLMTVRADGTLLRSTLHKSVIRSARSYTYEEVQQILDTGRGTNAVTLRRMNTLARTLTARRLDDGAIDFNVPDVRVVLGADGMPEAIVPRERLQSMRLIEEFMLLANRAVTDLVVQRSGRDRVLPFLYRVHDAPDPEKVRELTTFLSHLGLRVVLDARSSRSFQQMVESIVGMPESPVIQDITIRTMAKAVYSEKNIGHFGLGFARYTHFTSPIRRYPDLVVHRMLEAYATGARPPHGVEELAAIGLQSSERERTAMEAERESVRIMELAYMQRHLGDVLEGVISGVTAWGMYVELLDILVEGLVHVRSMSDDFYRFDADRRAMIGKRSGRRYRLGDRIHVQVAKIDPVDRHIDFVIAR
jgi:ribonuclease R